MIRPKAWIEGTFAEQPLSAAASLVLHARLEKIDRLAEQAAAAEGDTEPVHRLRVATRRASAALGIFQQTLPRRRQEWIEKQLKRARRAANEARNLDVLIQRYNERAEHNQVLGTGNGEDLSWLSKDLARCRQRAQKPLVSVARRFRRKSFAQRVEELFWRIHWRDEQQSEPTLLTAAERNLAEIAEDLLAFDPARATSESLHQLRICGKQLRYAMEIFAGALPELCERVYATVVEMQNLLGRANDHATAMVLFEDGAACGKNSKHAARYSELAEEERRACETSNAQCVDWLQGDAFRDLCDAVAAFATVENDAPPAPRPK